MQINETATPDLEQVGELLEQLMSAKTLGTGWGTKVKTQETIYRLGYNLYEQAKYEDAMRIFAFLMTANHLDRRFYLGFAACMHMQQRHQDALKYYGMASML